jgi:hypothetical protein
MGQDWRSSGHARQLSKDVLQFHHGLFRRSCIILPAISATWGVPLVLCQWHKNCY